MGSSTVNRNYDIFNAVTTYTVHNEDMSQLSLDREFLCSQLDDMKLLIGNRVTVGELNDRQKIFVVSVDDAVRSVPGAYEWVSELISKL